MGATVRLVTCHILIHVRGEGEEDTTVYRYVTPPPLPLAGEDNIKLPLGAPQSRLTPGTQKIPKQYTRRRGGQINFGLLRVCVCVCVCYTSTHSHSPSPPHLPTDTGPLLLSDPRTKAYPKFSKSATWDIYYVQNRCTADFGECVPSRKPCQMREHILGTRHSIENTFYQCVPSRKPCQMMEPNKTFYREHILGTRHSIENTFYHRESRAR